MTAEASSKREAHAAVPILSAENVTKHFHVKGQTVKAVSGVSLAIHANECVALVGESGSGKTTLSKLLLDLDSPTSGSIHYLGTPLGQLNKEQKRQFRRDVQPVFQNPYSSLNPRMRVKHIVAEPLAIHESLSASVKQQKIDWALEATGLRSSDGNKFPHEFSGGQRQRIAIARAIISKPKLIILDEPVSSQDISIQAQILNLLKDLKDELSMSYLFIAHDLATVRFMSDKLSVMYLGSLVEQGDSESIFRNPAHPYTRDLFNAALPDHPSQRDKVLPALSDIPSPLNLPTGCAYHTRCEYQIDQCQKDKPLLNTIETKTSLDHCVACWREKDIVNQ